jgi:hypothetical protein
MNKKDYYKLWGRVEAGRTEFSADEIYDLLNFTDSLINLIEQSTEDIDADLYGTEGWEHAIGWD